MTAPADTSPKPEPAGALAPPPEPQLSAEVPKPERVRLPGEPAEAERVRVPENFGQVIPLADKVETPRPAPAAQPAPVTQPKLAMKPMWDVAEEPRGRRWLGVGAMLVVVG
ncbi:MAG TPA: hypothetical protein VHM90_03925, partial [Phycisphaerae bacterium]|nr:hypothetical protein [Phycisphaerae bacterium]